MRPLIARRHAGPVPLPRQSPEPEAGPMGRDARSARFREDPDTARLRRDPAPSRLTYRVQRLWLTPLFRAMLRVGLPVFTVVAALLWYATDEAKMQALEDQIAEVRREIEDRPEFRINVLSIEGAGQTVTEDVRATLALSLPVSSFDLDLNELRSRVAALPAVASVSVRNAGGGTLAVVVAERVPAFIWQSRQGAVLLDAEGNFVAPLETRSPETPLPMIAGLGADRAVDEAASLFEAAQPLGERLLGLVRVGERRWDVVLREGPRILLPAEAPRAALDRVLLLHDVQELLDRDLVRIDLRNPSHMTVQLTPEAMETLDLQRAGLVPVGDERG
jgi:cell division protein FtsQ